jgi:sporulation protein YlmC with PRC-barrel domain
MIRRVSLLASVLVLLLLPLSCGSSRGTMSVSEFLRAPVTDREVITVRGQYIESLNDRTFAMGNGNDVILVVYPADNAAVGTRGSAGQTVEVTGTTQMFRRGDPAMPFVDDRIRDEYLHRPGIIATNVQVVDTGA